MDIYVKGFTLIELLVTIAVISIIAAIGVPNLAKISQINRAASQVNLVSGSLSLARSEAIKRDLKVVMCASSDSTSIPPSCSNSAWDKGWIVFVDQNDDSQYDAKNDVLLTVNGGFTGGVTMHYIAGTKAKSNFSSSVTFSSNGGLAQGENPGTFTVCTNSNAKEAKAVDVNMIGMIDLVKNPDTNNNIATDINGNTLKCP